MRRFTTLLAALLVLVGFAWAKKGGGGGGGGGGPALSGVFYVHLATPLAEGPYGFMDPVGSFALNPDGTVAQDLVGLGEWPPLGHPSYALHAGARVFLEQRDVFGYGTLPDGSQRRVLVARLEDGTLHELTTAGDDIRLLGASRWGKDDSFVSFAAIVWDAGGVASTHIFRAPVAWDGNGVPALTASPAAVVDGTVSGTQPVQGSLGGHDWSPDGTKLVYEDGAAVKVATFGASTTVVTISGDGAAPRWSPATGSERIAFTSRAGLELFLVDSDGQGLTLLDSKRQGANLRPPIGSPRWSPDGNHVAYAYTRDIKLPKNEANYTVDILVLPVTGGASTNVTSDVDDRVQYFGGWR